MIAAAVALGAGRVAVVAARAAAAIPRKAINSRLEMPILWQFALPAFLASVLVGPVSWIASAILVNQPDGLVQVARFNAANQWRQAVLFVPTVIGRRLRYGVAAGGGLRGDSSGSEAHGVGCCGRGVLGAGALIVGCDVDHALLRFGFADAGAVSRSSR